MPTLKVNNIDIYYDIHGQGQPLVFIAGLGLDLSEYGSLVTELAQNNRVLAFDNRGAGRSDKPDEAYTIEQMADDTAKLMEALDFKPAHILGFSMGGRIAIALALEKPELVQKLILVSTSARKTGRSWLVGLLGNFSKYSFGIGKYPQPHSAFKRQFQASREFDCTSRLWELKKPTLIMHGKHDWIVPLRLAKEMHRSINGSKIILFRGGHMFAFLQRKKFVKAVDSFLHNYFPQ